MRDKADLIRQLDSTGVHERRHAELLAVLGRIADALEAANANDPLLAISAAIAAKETAPEPEVADPPADVPPEERWRFER